jgi:hypothetical protein
MWLCQSYNKTCELIHALYSPLETTRLQGPLDPQAREKTCITSNTFLIFFRNCLHLRSNTLSMSFSSSGKSVASIADCAIFLNSFSSCRRGASKRKMEKAYSSSSQSSQSQSQSSSIWDILIFKNQQTITLQTYKSSPK